jgi:S-formylglutathione hydrolase
MSTCYEMHEEESHRCHGGTIAFFTHAADTTRCDMRFSVFTPDGIENGGRHSGPRPVFWWLSGLTCTADNFTTKAGAYGMAAEQGIIVVAADTSPRGEDVPDDPEYDLGQGAGFYVNATQSPWNEHFQMYDYLVEELPALIAEHFDADMSQQSISGHSMGGHGALVIGIKNPDRYRRISAFAPIVNPSQVPWGRKAFAAYLGDDEETWKAYDACELMRAAGDRSEFPEIVIEQGTADPNLGEQLQPEKFVEACGEVGQKVELRMREGYDHSYYFIAGFVAGVVV